MTTLLKVTKMPWFGLLKKGKIEKNLTPTITAFPNSTSVKKLTCCFNPLTPGFQLLLKISLSKENKQNHHQPKKPLIFYQILLASTSGNAWRKVWRIWTLMSGCKMFHEPEGKIRQRIN